MMPVVRVSDSTWERLKASARPLEDSVDDVVCRALDALERQSGTPPEPARAQAPVRRARRRGEKLPQKEFRLPLMKLLLDLGGQASVPEIRKRLEPIMAPRLSAADYELVTSGDERWWNAACWERADLVREGLFSDHSPRGTWALTDRGKQVARL